MSREILAALPRILGERSGDDYARLVRKSAPDQLMARAMSDTTRQLTQAYETTIAEILREADSHRRGGPR